MILQSATEPDPRRELRELETTRPIGEGPGLEWCTFGEEQGPLVDWRTRKRRTKPEPPPPCPPALLAGVKRLAHLEDTDPRGATEGKAALNALLQDPNLALPMEVALPLFWYAQGISQAEVALYCGGPNSIRTYSTPDGRITRSQGWTQSTISRRLQEAAEQLWMQPGGRRLVQTLTQVLGIAAPEVTAPAFTAAERSAFELKLCEVGLLPIPVDLAEDEYDQRLAVIARLMRKWRTLRSAPAVEWQREIARANWAVQKAEARHAQQEVPTDPRKLPHA